MTEQLPKPFAYFTIDLPIDDLFARLFSAGKRDGTLAFGFCASSVGPADRATIESGCNFLDFILEGHVKYQLKLEPADSGCVLTVGVFDGNRIDSIIPAIKHYLITANIDVSQLEMVDSSSSSL